MNTLSITPWERTFPFRGFDKLSDQIDRMFQARFPRFDNIEENLTVADWVPPVDIHETDKEFLVKAEIPEVKKDDVKITIEEGVLTIKGERKAEREEKGKTFHRTERMYGTFLRSFALPNEVEEAKAVAEFKDGMLTLHLPKSERAKPKTIEVKLVS
jgi:HSP20 family protein